MVAPFAGAWIEIKKLTYTKSSEGVAPFAGAWIEIQLVIDEFNRRGVAPFAGAWIEMSNIFLILAVSIGRSLRGSVD